MSLVQSVRTAAAQALQTRPKDATGGSANTGEFARVLRARLDEQHIAVSAHAADRMIRRGLIPDESTISQLQTAFDLAEQKGSREALFLLDDLAVIASVPSRTVKTVMDRGQCMGLLEAQQVSIDAISDLFQSEAVQEGVRAFLEKRPAKPRP